jgi:hypothetical protein
MSEHDAGGLGGEEVDSGPDVPEHPEGRDAEEWRRAAEAADAEDMAGGEAPDPAEEAARLAELARAEDTAMPPSELPPVHPGVEATSSAHADVTIAAPDHMTTHRAPDEDSSAPVSPRPFSTADMALPQRPFSAAETPLPERRFPTADTPVQGSAPLADAEEFVERAIESVLDQVPDVGDEEPEGSAKLQPWAETAAPPSKYKRPLSELLEQYAARVAAAPDAVAGRPRGQHPVAAFFARFTPLGGGRGAADAGAGGGRGRRRRGGRGAGATVLAGEAPGAGTPRGGAPAGAQAPSGQPRRRRRGRGGQDRAQGGAPGGARGGAQGPARAGVIDGGRGQRPQQGAGQAGSPPPAGDGTPRRRSRGRGRRRRGGGGGNDGGPAPAG